MSYVAKRGESTPWGREAPGAEVLKLRCTLMESVDVSLGKGTILLPVRVMIM